MLELAVVVGGGMTFLLDRAKQASLLEYRLTTKDA